MHRRLALIVVPSLVVVSAVGVVSAPPAQAIDTAGFTAEVLSNSASIAAGKRATLTQSCPSGTTPIAGGVSAASSVYRYQDYVNWGDGADVEESVENRSSTAQLATVYARCAATHWFHDAGRVVATFAEDNSYKHGGGYASCPSGSIALSARLDWNNTINQQSIDFSGPTTDLKSWVVAGTNQGIDNYMFADVQCVAATDVPGAFLVVSSWKNTVSFNDTGHAMAATCPAGMTLLNGGTFTLVGDGSVQFTWFVGSTYRSYPGDSAWNASSVVPYGYTMNVTAWCIPNREPSVSVVSGPPTYSANATAQFSFAATDPASAGGYALSYQCSVDDLSWSACTSPWSSTVSEGAHAFYVQVATSDGRRGRSLAYSWRYDQTVPTATMAAPTPRFTLTSHVTVAWNGSDGTGSGVSAFNVRYTQASYTGTFGQPQYPAAWQNTPTTSATSSLTAGSTQCYSALAIDRAGNQSAYSASACTAMPVDDSALTASGKWTRVSSDADWNGTYTTTTKKNATLTLTGVRLDRAGIVAVTCPTCGQVAVLVGTTQIGTINLHSKIARNQVIVALPKFTARTGTVTVKVVTSGKTVSIDGLAVSHR